MGDGEFKRTLNDSNKKLGCEHHSDNSALEPCYVPQHSHQPQAMLPEPVFSVTKSFSVYLAPWLFPILSLHQDSSTEDTIGLCAHDGGK